MTPRRKRMLWVGLIFVGVGIASFFAFQALNANLMYFYSPTQIVSGEAPAGAQIRAGGLVKAGSVRRDSDGLTVLFDISDTLMKLALNTPAYCQIYFVRAKALSQSEKSSTTNMLWLRRC